MQSVVIGGIKKSRIDRDAFRRVSQSKRRGIAVNFVTTSITKDVIVAISATIGSTSFRNSDNGPMCCHYSSTGIFACQDLPLGQGKYIIIESINQCKANPGAVKISTALSRGNGRGVSRAKKAKSKG